MAIVARVPSGDSIANTNTTTSVSFIQVTINPTAPSGGVGSVVQDPVAAGDILLVFCSTEGDDTSGAGQRMPTPLAIAGIDGFENGGLHPDGSTAFTTPSNGIIRVSNVTDSGTNPDLSSNTDSRWIDLGYAAGGYTGSSGTGIGGIGRNHSGIWAKVLTEADLLTTTVVADPQVDVTVTLDRIRLTEARLMVVSGASTTVADLATTINIARTTIANTRSSSSGAYSNTEWLGPNAPAQTAGQPQNVLFKGDAAVTSTTIVFNATAGQITVPDASIFTIGRVISISGAGEASNNGLHVITAINPGSDLLFTTGVGGPSVVTESAGETVTITSGGYSTGDLGDDFLAIFYSTNPPTVTPDPDGPQSAGSVRPPNVQSTTSGTLGNWGIDGEYPAGDSATSAGHSRNWYWDQQDSFQTFDDLWSHDASGSSAAGEQDRFAWDMTSESIWAFTSHLLLLKEESAGGTDHPLPVTDTSTASDTLTLTKATTETKTDTATTSDTLSASRTVTETNTDSSTASDTLTTQKAATESNTDSSTASDTLTATKASSLSVTDSATSSDTLSATKSKDITKTDSSTASDTLATTRAATQASTDSSTAADTLTAVKSASISITDSATASDVYTDTEANVLTETDSATAADTLVTARSATITITDSSTTSDTLSATKSVALTFIDSSSSSDTLAATRSTPFTETDSSTASDTLSVTKSVALTVTDSVAVSDTLSAVQSDLGVFTETDSSTASDTLDITVSKTISITDSTTTSDTLVVSKGIIFTTVDSVSTLDTLLKIRGVNQSFIDSASSGDSIDSSHGNVVIFADISSVSDTVSTVGPTVQEIEVVISGFAGVVSELLTEVDALAVIDVWNTALNTLGISTLTEVEGSTPQQKLLSNVFPLFRQQFLSDHMWNGAKKTAKLIKLTTTETENPALGRWDYAWELPDKALRIWRLNGLENRPKHIGGNANIDINRWEIEIITISSKNYRALLTNESEATIEYIADINDAGVALLGPSTQHAMGMALAVYVATNFGKSASEIAQLDAMAKEAITAAKGIDGQEGTPQMFGNTSLLGVRYIGN